MENPSLHCQDYAVLDDGRILSVQGNQRADGYVFGEIAFAPRSCGPYARGSLFYQKPYLYTDTTANLSVDGLRRDVLPGNHFAHHFPTKSIVNQNSIHKIVNRVTAHHRIATLDSTLGDLVRNTTDWTKSFLDLDNSIVVGLTGSLALFDVPAERVHDVDIVLHGDSNECRRWLSILKHRYNEGRYIVTEWGRSWVIRTMTPYGIVCLFFVCCDLPAMPTIINVSETLQSPIVVQVTDARFNMTSPIVLRVQTEIGENLPCVSYDLRLRGDLEMGDTLQIEGSRANTSPLLGHDECFLATSIAKI